MARPIKGLTGFETGREQELEKRKLSSVDGGIMCKCGCGGVATYIIESYDYEGQPFKEPCCVSSRDYLRDGAQIFNQPYKETLCKHTLTEGIN